MGAFGKTSRRQIQVSERVLRVVDLRLQGHNLREIAKVIGVSAPTVWRDLVRYLKGIGETIETKRGLSEARLDRALLRMHPRLEAGEPDAVRTLVSVESRRAKLRGLDAPVEIRKAVATVVKIEFNLNPVEREAAQVVGPSLPLLPAPTALGAASLLGGTGVDSGTVSIRSASSAEKSTAGVGSPRRSRKGDSAAPGDSELAESNASDDDSDVR